MLTPLEFPSDDDDALRRDCDRLEDIISDDAECYAAWLHSIRNLCPQSDSGSAVRPSPRGGEDTRSAGQAIARYGVSGAVSRGLITVNVLRQIARSPELLVKIADEVFEDGDISVWSAIAERQDHLIDVDSVAAFEAALMRWARGELQGQPGPVFENCDSEIKHPSERMTGARHLGCIMRVPLVQDSPLLLHFLDQVWGGLFARRQARDTVEIGATTGICQKWSAPPMLQVRWAATSEPNELSEHCVEYDLGLVPGGIELQLWIPIRQLPGEPTM